MQHWRKSKLNIFLQYSNGVRYPSDLRGLLLSFHSTSAMNSSDNSLKSVPLGIYCLIRPLMFSLAPRCLSCSTSCLCGAGCLPFLCCLCVSAAISIYIWYPRIRTISRPRCGEQIRGVLLARPRITVLYSLTALH